MFHTEFNNIENVLEKCNIIETFIYLFIFKFAPSKDTIDYNIYIQSMSATEWSLSRHYSLVPLAIQ